MLYNVLLYYEMLLLSFIINPSQHIIHISLQRLGAREPHLAPHLSGVFFWRQTTRRQRPAAMTMLMMMIMIVDVSRLIHNKNQQPALRRKTIMYNSFYLFAILRMRIWCAARMPSLYLHHPHTHTWTPDTHPQTFLLTHTLSRKTCIAKTYRITSALYACVCWMVCGFCSKIFDFKYTIHIQTHIKYISLVHLVAGSGLA